MENVTPSQMLRDPYFWDNVRQIGDCWEWRGGSNQDGYGRWVRWFGARSGKTHLVHRLVYMLMVGDIPPGLVLDHLCRNTLCINPDHLDPVTDRVNLMRGESPSAKAARATHCKAGHPYSGDNLWISKGYRLCRTCKREQAADRNRKLTAARRAAMEAKTCLECGVSLRHKTNIRAKYCSSACKQRYLKRQR